MLAAARDRYVIRGAISGTARVPDLTAKERDALIALFGAYVKTRPGEELRVGLPALDAALRQGGWPEGLVEVWCRLEGAPVRTRAQERQALQRRRQAFSRHIVSLRDAASGRARDWLDDLLASVSGEAADPAPAASPDAAAAVSAPSPAVPVSAGTAPSPAPAAGAPPPPSGLRAEMLAAERIGDLDYATLLAGVACVARALAALPADAGVVSRLPVFAREVTGDPHGLDEGTLAGRLLLAALVSAVGGSAAAGLAAPPRTAVERGMLLAAAGILTDGVSSSVAVFGLAGATRRGAGADPVVAAAAADRAVLIAPLRQVQGWSALEPGGPVLYAVENPAVFEELADALAASARSTPLLCPSGFPSVAALRLLDLAVAAGARIAYGGDFDGNGLAIAASLLRRYGDRIRLWGMSPEDYRSAAADPLATDLSPADARRLADHDATPLADLARAMRSVGKRAYQEALVGRLREALAPPGR